MSANLFVLFRKLIPTYPLQVGGVLSRDGDTATIEMPGGGRLTARGPGAVGTKVFVRNGAIEGAAPSLTIETIDV